LGSVVLLKGGDGDDTLSVRFNGIPGGVIGVDGGPGADTLNLLNVESLPEPRQLKPDPNVPGSGELLTQGVVVLCYANIEKIPATAFQAASFLLPTKDPNSGKPNFGVVVTGNVFFPSDQLSNLPFAPVIAQPNPISEFGFSAPTLAIGDVNEDGFPDLVVAMGSGYAPLVTVFDGRSIFIAGSAKNPTILAEFFAYNTLFAGGVYVAVGNVQGASPPPGQIKGQPNIITGAGRGAGPGDGQLQIFKYKGGYDPTKFPGGGVNLTYSDPNVYPGFTGGVRVASGDVNGDGKDDIVTGAGPGGGPHVKVISGPNKALLASFMAYGSFSGGVFVAAGKFNNADANADVMTGAGFGGSPHIKVFNGATIANPNPGLLASFFAFPSPSVPPNGLFGGTGALTAGVSGVAFGSQEAANGDKKAAILAGSGLGQPAELRLFDAGNLTELSDTFFTFDTKTNTVGQAPVFGPNVLIAGVNVAGILF
jgi:hypothetical protein